MINDQITVLIVEDELLIAKDIQSIIESEGYKVSGIANSFEKVKSICSDINCVDVVICDINLKGEKDGIDVIEYLREHYFFSVIFLTAYTDAKTVEKTKNQNAQAYIVKPFTPVQLLTTLNLHKPSKEVLMQKKLLQSLRKREMEICKMMLKGYIEDEIADRLFLSKHTIHTHRKNIYRKLNIAKITELYQFELFKIYKTRS